MRTSSWSWFLNFTKNLRRAKTKIALLIKNNRWPSRVKKLTKGSARRLQAQLITRVFFPQLITRLSLHPGPIVTVARINQWCSSHRMAGSGRTSSQKFQATLWQTKCSNCLNRKMGKGKWSQFPTPGLEFIFGNEAMLWHALRTRLRRSMSSPKWESSNDKSAPQTTNSTRRPTSAQTNKFLMKQSIRSGSWWMPANKLNQGHISINGLPLTASWQVISDQLLLKSKLQETRSC